MNRFCLWILTAVLCFAPYLSLVDAQEKKPPIRFGLQVAQQQTTVEELKEVWKEAEALAFMTWGVATTHESRGAGAIQ